MTKFNAMNPEHVAIVVSAAEESWLNCRGVSRAIGDALEDEGIAADEKAYSLGLAAVRDFERAARLAKAE